MYGILTLSIIHIWRLTSKARKHPQFQTAHFSRTGSLWSNENGTENILACKSGGNFATGSEGTT